MKSFLGLITAVSISVSAFAQEQNLLVKGMVLDDRNEAVAFAEVKVWQLNNETPIAATVTSESGDFEINVPEGQYELEIDFFGMNTKKIKLSQKNGTLDLGKIALKEEKTTSLSGVEIVSERSQMALKIDKRVFNVASDLASQSGTASEVLQNIPSVSVDAEGNVSLRGSQDVRILIDGKVSGFASSADALQQLQANMIDRIEVITNASSRYDAQGESGILNIILKKDKKHGFNGAATLRGGYTPDDGISLNANHRSGKFNLYGSASYDYRRVNGRSTTNQRLENTDTAFRYIQGYQHTRKSNNLGGRIGADYSINENNTLGANVSYRIGRGKNLIDRTYDNYTLAEDFINKDTRTEWQKEKEDMIEAAVNYEMKLKPKGSTWKTTVSGFIEKDFENSDYKEYSSNNVLDTLTERSNAYNTQKYLLFQSDLVLPFSETGKVESGVKGQMRDFENEFGYSALKNSDWIGDPKFNDRFKFNEKVYAAYVMGSNTYGKLGVQAGLRAEYSEVFTHQYSLPNGNMRPYFNLFPSLAFSYQQSQQTTYQLSYSRRINRPGQWGLMPFMKFGDNRAMRVGNPDLDPELTDAYEAGILSNWEKGSLLSSAYYRSTKNKFDRVSYLGSDGVIYSKMYNIFNRNAYGLEFNLNYYPTTWGKISSGFNFFRESIQGNWEGQDMSYGNFSWSNRTSINVSLPQQWRVQLSGVYEAPTVSLQGKRLSMYFMDFAMSKNVLKNRGTLGFTVNDLLNSRRWRGTVNTPEIQSQTMFQWKQRSARVTFTWRINQQVREKENLLEGQGPVQEG
ncbi:MAG TPA: TonB-dependent receptor [Edaphocola sp.]|nr:TonB-dependent receptor [Edaphocola sp.]